MKCDNYGWIMSLTLLCHIVQLDVMCTTFSTFLHLHAGWCYCPDES